jgi:hypothetical protein
MLLAGDTVACQVELAARRPRARRGGGVDTCLTQAPAGACAEHRAREVIGPMVSRLAACDMPFMSVANLVDM